MVKSDLNLNPNRQTKRHRQADTQIKRHRQTERQTDRYETFS